MGKGGTEQGTKRGQLEVWGGRSEGLGASLRMADCCGSDHPSWEVELVMLASLYDGMAFIPAETSSPGAPSERFGTHNLNLGRACFLAVCTESLSGQRCENPFPSGFQM